MNSSDRVQVKRDVEKKQGHEEILNGNIKIVLQSKAGQEFVWWLLGITLDSNVCFVPGGMDGERQTNFNLGMRNVGIQLKSKMEEVLPGSYAAITNERKENGQ